MHRAKCSGHHFGAGLLTLSGGEFRHGYALTLGPRRHDADENRLGVILLPRHGGSKPQLVVYVCMIDCFASKFPVEDDHAVVAESGPVNSARCHWVECRGIAKP